MKVEKNQTRSIFNQEENHYVDLDLKNHILKSDFKVTCVVTTNLFEERVDLQYSKVDQSDTEDNSIAQVFLEELNSVEEEISAPGTFLKKQVREDKVDVDLDYSRNLDNSVSANNQFVECVKVKTAEKIEGYAEVKIDVQELLENLIESIENDIPRSMDNVERKSEMITDLQDDHSISDLIISSSLISRDDTLATVSARNHSEGSISCQNNEEDMVTLGLQFRNKKMNMKINNILKGRNSTEDLLYSMLMKMKEKMVAMEYAHQEGDIRRIEMLKIQETSKNLEENQIKMQDFKEKLKKAAAEIKELKKDKKSIAVENSELKKQLKDQSKSMISKERSI